MKKTVQLFIVLVFIGLSARVNAQIVNIPDPNFYTALVNNGVHDSSGYITADTAMAFTGSLNVAGAGISDLTGIEAFTSIVGLDCSSNNLTSLDVSANTALTSLNCYSNGISILDISSNPALASLDCHEDNIGVLDVSFHPALSSLSCYFNVALSSLDVSFDTALAVLDCHGNSISSLDLSSNKALTNLDCSYNGLTSLDVSANTALNNLECGDNNLASLNVSSCKAISSLDCNSNSLTNLDVSADTALYSLTCPYNNITNLDLSSNHYLAVLFCDNDSLRSLNVRNGNNINMSGSNFFASNNPDLFCIEVDSVAYSTANWTQIDSWASFSLNCAPLSVNEIATVDGISIYPDPATNELKINGELKMTNPIAYIMNALGQTILQSAIANPQSAIDVSSLPSGLYFIRLADDKERWVGRFVKD